MEFKSIRNFWWLIYISITGIDAATNWYLRNTILTNIIIITIQHNIKESNDINLFNTSVCATDFSEEVLIVSNSDLALAQEFGKVICFTHVSNQEHRSLQPPHKENTHHPDLSTNSLAFLSWTFLSCYLVLTVFVRSVRLSSILRVLQSSTW